METKVTKSDRLDQLDAERYREMLESAPFRLYLERVRAEWDRARETCTTADGELQLRRAQGAAAALRTALALPAQILEEIKANTRKSK